MTLFIWIMFIVISVPTAVVIIKKEKFPDFKTMFFKLDRLNVLTYVFLPIVITAFKFIRSDLSDIDLTMMYLLIFFGYITAISDLRYKKIPNKYALSMLGVWVLITVPRLLIDIQTTVDYVISAGLGLLFSGGILLTIYLISRGGLGGGDVKFMSAAGLYLTLNGVLPAMLFGSVLSAITGIVLILSKRINKKDSIPLAPFLYAGILITIFLV